VLITVHRILSPKACQCQLIVKLTTSITNSNGPATQWITIASLHKPKAASEIRYAPGDLPKDRQSQISYPKYFAALHIARSCSKIIKFPLNLKDKLQQHCKETEKHRKDHLHVTKIRFVFGKYTSKSVIQYQSKTQTHQHH